MAEGFTQLSFLVAKVLVVSICTGLLLQHAWVGAVTKFSDSVYKKF